MNKEIIKPDTLADIENTDLVQLSRRLLGSVVESTRLLQPHEMTKDKLQEAKMVLGFLNATTSAVKAKMQFFNMIGLEGKVAAVKKQSENL